MGYFFLPFFFATKNSPFGKSDDKPWDLGGYHFFKQVQIDPIKQVIFDRKKNMDDFLAKAYYQIYKGFSWNSSISCISEAILYQHSGGMEDAAYNTEWEGLM